MSIMSVNVSADCGTKPGGIVRVASLIEISIAAYFFLSFLYYIDLLPSGHIVNILFLFVFLSFLILRQGHILLPAGEIKIALLLLALPVVSVCSWVLRADWYGSELIRSLSWLTPLVFLLLLVNYPKVRHDRICLATGFISLVVNLFVTIVFATLNTGLAKFEVNSSWTWISSNELSFHLIGFSVFFFLLAGRKRASAGAALISLGSMVHLSKAHLASMVLAPIIGFCRRRAWMVFALLLFAFVFLRYLLISDFLESMEIPFGLQRVFVPMRDLVSIFIRLLFSGYFPDLAAMGDSIGVYRFEVYMTAFELIPNLPFGTSADAVVLALNGLDPHSNLSYLALREGWGILSLYLATMAGLILRLPISNLRGRLVTAVLIYIFLRTVFLTFDPIKLICLGLYAFFALAAQEREGAVEVGRVPGNGAAGT